MGDARIPKTDSERLNWLLNYRDMIAAYGGALGMRQEEVTAMHREIDACQAAHDGISQLRMTLHAAVTTLRTQERVLVEKIREQIVRAKAGANDSEQMGQLLRATEVGAAFDPDTFKPTLNLMAEAGAVRVDFVKGEADAVNIYSRIRGQTAWRFIARDTNSPYMDCTPPAGNVTTEVREYMLRGVLNDEEIGQASEVLLAKCEESIRELIPQPGKRVGRWA